MRILTAARLRRGVGILPVRFHARARHEREMGHTRAAGSLRRADRFAEFHERLVPVARRGGREDVLGGRGELLPAARRAEVAANGAEPRENARDVAVEDGERNVIRDAQDGGGGVASDAGEREGGFERTRKFRRCGAATISLGGAVQIASAAVVAEAGPQAQHFLRGARASDSTGGNVFRKRS